jgi:hypothetical protein
VVEDRGVTLLPARAVRWVDDEPFPGLVEVVFTDAEGADRVLIDKCVIFGDSLTRAAAYPVVVEIPVEVLQQRTTPAGEVSAIRLPWGLADDPIEVRSSELIDRP